MASRSVYVALTAIMEAATERRDRLDRNSLLARRSWIFRLTAQVAVRERAVQGTSCPAGARVAANEPLATCERAFRMIQDEHRSIAMIMISVRQLTVSPGELTQVELQHPDLLK